MNYNNIIGVLKAWCREKGDRYHEYYRKAGGETYIKYLVTGELQFHLSMLMAREFSSPEDFLEQVKASYWHFYDISLQREKTPVQTYMIQTIYDEFSLYMETVLQTDIYTLSSPLPYERVIIGEEAEALFARFWDVFEYDVNTYWYPLCGGEPQKVSEKCYFMSEHIEPYWADICKLVGIPEKRVYALCDSAYQIPFCMETEDMTFDECSETVYTNYDFTWMIYFSHEDTVAFAGDIVPKVKTLLKDKAEHMNRYEG